MRFADIHGLTMHYALSGAGHAGPVVFMNSLGTDLRLWQAVLPGLNQPFQIICYDKRGHGLSGAPPGPYTIGDHARDLAGLLDMLKIESALVVGISVGGMIAMEFALRFPGRVRALVLCDTAPKIGTPEFWDERIQALRERGMEPLADTILARWFLPSFASEHPAEYRGFAHMLARQPLEGYLSTCAALRDADLGDSVKAITANALLLCGAGDISTPPDQMRELAAALPNARFQVIEGAAHLPCIEQPAAMAAIIHQFFQDNGHV
jgi:3-oxoadipate enol-lactonase